MNSQASGVLGGFASIGLRSAWPLVVVIAVTALLTVFFSGLQLMIAWGNGPEYSHAWLIPPIVAFLVWQRNTLLRQHPFSGSWWGVVLVVCGLMLWLLGELSSLYAIIQYAFLVTLAGAVLAFTGGPAFRRLTVPLSLLFF